MMAQNTSHAVMAQRTEAHDSLDFFPTPPWATRALVEHVLIGHGWGRHQFGDMLCWEPACGAGHMARPLAEYFKDVVATDCHDYGFGRVHDFLLPDSKRADFVITNPPFRLGREFVERGRQVARQGVAMLVRTAFLEGGERYRALFNPYPPLIVAPFVERVVMSKGRLLDPNKSYPDPKTGKPKRPSTATSYAWIVWSGRKFTRTNRNACVVWIPPCRKALERPGDYE